MSNQELKIFQSIGALASLNKQQFVDLLQSFGVVCSINQPIEELIDLYIQNAPEKKELIVGSAYFAIYQSTESAFDGSKNVDNELVHKVGKQIFSYFDWRQSLKNVGQGFKEKGWAGGLGAAIDVASSKTQQPNLSQAGTEALRRQQEARAAMIQGAADVEKARNEAIQANAKAKQKTILIIGGISVAVLGLTILGIYLYKKR